MWCNQMFSLLSLAQEATEEKPAVYKIENIIVADSYEFASKIARTNYGNSALAVDTTAYPVSIGFQYIAGNFYNTNGELVVKNKTEEERIAELEEIVAIHEENDAELLYQICLLQLGITEEDMM